MVLVFCSVPDRCGRGSCSLQFQLQVHWLHWRWPQEGCEGLPCKTLWNLLTPHWKQNRECRTKPSYYTPVPVISCALHYCAIGRFLHWMLVFRLLSFPPECPASPAWRAMTCSTPMVPLCATSLPPVPRHAPRPSSWSSPTLSTPLSPSHQRCLFIRRWRAGNESSHCCPDSIIRATS